MNRMQIYTRYGNNRPNKRQKALIENTLIQILYSNYHVNHENNNNTQPVIEQYKIITFDTKYYTIL